MNKFNQSFWKEKYKDQKTGWDIGHPSTPLQHYIEQLTDKEISILIPGCGNGYEAEFLHQLGFKNVTILDLIKQPLDNFNKRVPSFPKDLLIHANFFSHQKQYDLILEQTFFCALHPELRKDYIKKMQELLTTNGKLVGLLFDFPLTKDGPPFGGSMKEYIDNFSKCFKLKKLERSYNSIEERKDKELFFIFEPLIEKINNK